MASADKAGKTDDGIVRPAPDADAAYDARQYELWSASATVDEICSGQAAPTEAAAELTNSDLLWTGMVHDAADRGSQLAVDHAAQYLRANLSSTSGEAAECAADMAESVAQIAMNTHERDVFVGVYADTQARLQLSVREKIKLFEAGGVTATEADVSEFVKAAQAEIQRRDANVTGTYDPAAQCFVGPALANPGSLNVAAAFPVASQSMASSSTERPAVRVLAHSSREVPAIAKTIEEPAAPVAVTAAQPPELSAMEVDPLPLAPADKLQPGESWADTVEPLAVLGGVSEERLDAAPQLKAPENPANAKRPVADPQESATVEPPKSCDGSTADKTTANAGRGTAADSSEGVPSVAQPQAPCQEDVSMGQERTHSTEPVSQWADISELRSLSYTLSENGCDWTQLHRNPLLWQATLTMLGADRLACAWLWGLANLNSIGWEQASVILLECIHERKLPGYVGKTIEKERQRHMSKFLTARCKEAMKTHNVTHGHPLYAKKIYTELVKQGVSERTAWYKAAEGVALGEVDAGLPHWQADVQAVTRCMCVPTGLVDSSRPMSRCPAPSLAEGTADISCGQLLANIMQGQWHDCTFKYTQCKDAQEETLTLEHNWQRELDTVMPKYTDAEKQAWNAGKRMKR